MKLKIFRYVGAVGIAALPIVGQNNQNSTQEHHRYKLIDLGTLGGPNSYVNGPGVRDISNQGIYAGQADTSTPDLDAPGCDPGTCFIQHALKWQDGVRTDLGALGNGNNTSGTVWISANGRFIVGASENGEIDPLLGVPEGRAVLWTADGTIHDLGTIEGGTQSFGIAVNNRGQVTGISTDTTPDSFSMWCYQFAICPTTQTRSFVWQDGVKQDLGTLGGRDAYSDGINERGQIWGSSYVNDVKNAITGVPTTDPFLWEKGKMVDVGTLGGTNGGPSWVNARGQMVGTSDLAGDLSHHAFFWQRGGPIQDIPTFGGSNGNALQINDAGEIIGRADLPGDLIHHAFVWKNGVMADVGVIEGDLCSNARAINNRGQAVGTSTNCHDVVEHLFLWEKGVTYDLDALVLPGSNIRLRDPRDINDMGIIAAAGYLPNGDQHAVLLVPATAADIASAAALPAASVPAPAARLMTTTADDPISPNRTLNRYRHLPRRP
jgi:probable HAF family extracellular repeat protein